MRAALVAVTLVVATATTAAGAQGKSRPVLHGGAFFSNCLFSHGSNDDPIVYPGQPGKSHAHTFFGNVSTNARSTVASLRTARTTCRVPGDRAAYWIPTLFQNGREVRPVKAQFYYLMRGYAEMRPFPPGLRMIAGDAHAVGPQSGRVVYWACGAGGGVRSAATSAIPACRPARTRFHGEVRWEKTFLELHVNFPDCWDGRRLDSADHRSHMAHSVDYVCPSSHRVKLPLIRLNVQYPATGGTGLALSSGGISPATPTSSTLGTRPCSTGWYASASPTGATTRFCSSGANDVRAVPREPIAGAHSDTRPSAPEGVVQANKIGHVHPEQTAASSACSRELGDTSRWGITRVQACARAQRAGDEGD